MRRQHGVLLQLIFVCAALCSGCETVVLPERIKTFAVVSNNEIAAAEAANKARRNNFRTFRPSDLQKYLGSDSKLRKFAHRQGADAILIVETERATRVQMNSPYPQYQVPGSVRLIDAEDGMTLWSSSVKVGIGISEVYAITGCVSQAMWNFPIKP